MCLKYPGFEIVNVREHNKKPIFVLYFVKSLKNLRIAYSYVKYFIRKEKHTFSCESTEVKRQVTLTENQIFMKSFEQRPLKRLVRKLQTLCLLR